MEVTGAFWSGRASLPVEGKWGVGRKGGGGVEAVTPQVCGLARRRSPSSHGKSQPLCGPLLPGVRRPGLVLTLLRPFCVFPVSPVSHCVPCEPVPCPFGFLRTRTPTAQTPLLSPERQCGAPAPRQHVGARQHEPPAQGAARQPLP